MTTTLTAAAPASPPVEDALSGYRYAWWAHRSESTRRLPKVPSVWGLLEYILLAGLAYIPFLEVDRGVVTSDTKTYLYLDPSRFLSQVWSMWNPTVGLGTVTHEYVGYLWPMGPFFAGLAGLHVPIWIAQRLWIGTVLFGAGSGIVYLGKTLQLKAPGRTVAALAFMLSPYVLQYAGRISVILLPWAGLPWMVAFAAKSLRRGGWRYPALFAIVVATISGINASSILYVGLAPVAWLLYACFVGKEARFARTLWTALKIGLLTFLLSLWWIAGLQVEAAYGVDVLRFTETVLATSSTGNAAEVIRGLGYWYFYGSDSFGPWTYSSILLTSQSWLVGMTYAVPIFGFLGAAFSRWRNRAFFALMVVLGVVLSVGAFPFSHPTPLGGLFKEFMSDTTAGLAMRSTDRATPLVILGLAMLLGSGLAALVARVRWVGFLTALVAAGVVIAANPALFNGDAAVANAFTQPATLPSYELAAIDHLNATNPGTRVFAIPGNDFASYRWGDTVDTPQSALLTRPFVTHEQQIMGSQATADMLSASDSPIQTNVEDWTGLAPMARLMSAGDVLTEYDQAFDHYGAPPPQTIAADLAKTPAGLSNPQSYGIPLPNFSAIPTLDEQDLSNPASIPWTAPVQSFTVTIPRPITRAESTAGAIVLAGDATGLQDLADAGLLNTSNAIYYSGALDKVPSRLQALAAKGATLVISDTNRKQAFRWDSLSGNYGFTETASDNPAKTDPSDSPVVLFPKAPIGAHTTADYSGAVNVTSSTYGNTVSYTPEDQAYSAVDNNPDTAWETGTFSASVAGQWWQIQYPGAITTNQVNLTQPLSGTTSRWITKVTLSFDGRHQVTENLGHASKVSGGQTITFPSRSFHTLRITIDRSSSGTDSLATATAVGFSEVAVPGHPVVQVIAMPKDILGALGTKSNGNRLLISMARQHVSPYPPRTDPETTITREFTLPSARTFSLSGTASISGLIPDDAIDRLVGMAGSTGSGPVAYSKGRLPGDLSAGAAATISASPATSWQPGFGISAHSDEWLQYNLPSTLTFSHMKLQVDADGRHSIPTGMRITTETATQIVTGTQNIALPAIADSSVPGSTTSIPLTFLPMTGRRIRITFTGLRLEHASNYYSTSALGLPLGIDKVGIPGLHAGGIPTTVPGSCQSNLIKIDGQPISVAVVGHSSTALANGTLSVVPCGSDANGFTLSPGPHYVQTALGHTESTVDCGATSSCTGWNVNSLLLDSAPGGGPQPTTFSGTLPAPVPASAPTVSVLGQSLDSEQASVKGASTTFEFVFGQSVNPGWHAVADPPPGAQASAHPIDLGPPSLVDGFANGWHVTTTDLARLGVTGSHPDGQPFTVELAWTPQGEENFALTVSVLTGILCLIICFIPESLKRVLRRRSRALAVWRHPATQVVSAESELVFSVGETEPRLSFPAGWFGARPHLVTAVLAAAATGAAASAISSPWVGPAVAIAVLTGLLLGPARAITSMTAACLMATAGIRIFTEQVHGNRYIGAGFASTHLTEGVLVWMAVVFLGADGVVEAGRNLAERRRLVRVLRDESDPEPEPEPEPDGDFDGGGAAVGDDVTKDTADANAESESSPSVEIPGESDVTSTAEPDPNAEVRSTVAEIAYTFPVDEVDEKSADEAEADADSQPDADVNAVSEPDND